MFQLLKLAIICIFLQKQAILLATFQKINYDSFM